jgi:hypothetical protein
MARGWGVLGVKTQTGDFLYDMEHRKSQLNLPGRSGPPLPIRRTRPALPKQASGTPTEPAPKSDREPNRMDVRTVAGLASKLPPRFINNVDHGQTLRWPSGLSCCCCSFLISRCTRMVHEHEQSHGNDRERAHNVRDEVSC